MEHKEYMISRRNTLLSIASEQLVTINEIILSKNISVTRQALMSEYKNTQNEINKLMLEIPQTFEIIEEEIEHISKINGLLDVLFESQKLHKLQEEYENEELVKTLKKINNIIQN